MNDSVLLPTLRAFIESEEDEIETFLISHPELLQVEALNLLQQWFAQALAEQEIEVLQQNLSGLPKLLGFDINERWMVTEFFPNGTLEDHLLEYRGNAALALKAFRSVVATIALLHNEGKVHRDIKPANIFIGKEHEFVLGDFGLVYVPNREPRITRFQAETVGLVTSSLRRRGEAWALGLRPLRLASTCTCSAKFFGAWSLANPSSTGNFGMSPRTT